jgi:hypothetical protein
MAVRKAPPIDTTDANAPDTQGIIAPVSTDTVKGVVATIAAPLWSTFHVDSGGGGGQYAYPTSSG